MAKVLIVEDDVQVARMYSDKLEMAGHDIIVAVDGKEGLDKAVAEKPDVVLLDIFMPDTDGVAMLKNLRAHEAGKDVPVIILTNSFEPEGLETIKGMYSDYVLKVDLALDDLVDKVQKYTS